MAVPVTVAGSATTSCTGRYALRVSVLSALVPDATTGIAKFPVMTGNSTGWGRFSFSGTPGRGRPPPTTSPAPQVSKNMQQIRSPVHLLRRRPAGRYLAGSAGPNSLDRMWVNCSTAPLVASYTA